MEKTAVITGGSRGIGLAVAHSLARRGYRLVLVARDGERLRAAAGTLPGAADSVAADLSTIAGTTSAAQRVREAVDSIDVLVHNAGVWPSRRVMTDDGFETAFATNHLSPFLLSHLLEDLLLASAARVVHVSAGIYVKGRVDLRATPTGEQFSSLRTYADTKLASLLLLPLWASRWEGTGVAVSAVHPGVVRTDLGDRGGPTGLLLRLAKRRWLPPAEGARPVVALAVSGGTAQSGCYYEGGAASPVEPAEAARDADLAHAVWGHAARATGVPVSVHR